MSACYASDSSEYRSTNLQSPLGTGGDRGVCRVSSNSFAWLMLVASIAAEVIGTVALRLSEGFSRPIPSVVTCPLFGASILLMAIVVKHLEAGFVYAIWAGCSTAFAALLGIAFFRETADVARLVGLGLIVSGVIVLNLRS
jgi:small multidrug resistance pump